MGERKTLDGILENFDLAACKPQEPTLKRSLTLWLPKEYKDKYDEIQGQSRGKFGKVLQEVIKSSIDKVSTTGAL